MPLPFLEVLEVVARLSEDEFADTHAQVLVEPAALARLAESARMDETQTAQDFVRPEDVSFFVLSEDLGDVIVIGSGPGAQLRIDGRDVAIRHAALERRSAGTWLLRDLKSGRRTRINGGPVPPGFPMPLPPGAEFELGLVRLQLLSPRELYQLVLPLAKDAPERDPLPVGANIVARCDPLAVLLLAPEVPVIVGRSRSCALTLPHSNVSRRHAELTRVGDRVRVRDLDSSNGVTLGDHELPAGGEAFLYPGEESIGIGPFEIRVLLMEGESEDMSEALGTRRFVKRKREDEPLQGSLETMPLRQLVQAIELNQRSGTIELDGGEGRLVFVQGRPEWATYRRAEGERAVLRMLVQRRGNFRFTARPEHLVPPSPPTANALVTSSFTRLILESTRIRDELARTETAETTRQDPPSFESRGVARP